MHSTNNLREVSKEQEIKNWIVHWFQENSGIQEEEILKNLNLNYLEKGWMDSFAFIGFITHIEQQFGIAFLNDEFQDRSFATVDGLTKIIKRKIDVEK